MLCYYEADKDVISDAPGECYATYWVTTAGRVRNIQGFGCMHDSLLGPAKLAFENRLYLPALKNGKPIQMAVDGEIRYSPASGHAYPFTGEVHSEATLNGDARVQSCPLAEPPRTQKRSGHCIYEFDLTPEGSISQIRQIKCTNASLKPVTLASFNQCRFTPAKTDGSAIMRRYMTHQIDVNVYDPTGQKIPAHAAFGEKAVNKPYVVYEGG